MGPVGDFLDSVMSGLYLYHYYMNPFEYGATIPGGFDQHILVS